MQFDLRPLRNVIVKKGSDDDDSAIYEIFSRLNSGGVNLKPQEIRASLYHSVFYERLAKINLAPEWRRLTGRPQPDPRVKDVEILLRCFAMLIDGGKYSPSMLKFLNQFSKKAQRIPPGRVDYLEGLIDSFFSATANLSADTFVSKRTRRFNFALLEAVFAAVCREPFSADKMVTGSVSQEGVASLATDDDFVKASLEGTTRTANVKARLRRAHEILIPS